jgi:hypothetical protein
MLQATGHYDSIRGIAFMPHSDSEQGTLGWEMVIDGDPNCALIYVVPHFDIGTVEIRCHATMDDYVDPENDEVLGTVPIPPHFYERNGTG